MLIAVHRVPPGSAQENALQSPEPVASGKPKHTEKGLGKPEVLRPGLLMLRTEDLTIVPMACPAWKPGTMSSERQLRAV